MLYGCDIWFRQRVSTVTVYTLLSCRRNRPMRICATCRFWICSSRKPWGRSPLCKSKFCEMRPRGGVSEQTNGWVIDWLIEWVSEWVSDWLTDWLTDWLIDWLIVQRHTGLRMNAFECNTLELCEMMASFATLLNETNKQTDAYLMLLSECRHSCLAYLSIRSFLYWLPNFSLGCLPWVFDR